MTDTPGGPALSGEAQRVWDAMRAVYAGFLAGRPGDVDAHLHADVTIWDSGHEPLVQGLAGLAALRAARPSAGGAGPRVTDLAATDPVVDVWGDVAVLRHVLRVRFDGAPDEVVRNTSVWRRQPDGRWLAVHNHEDVVGGV